LGIKRVNRIKITIRIRSRKPPPKKL
jgi:hypothetical protein